LILSQRLQRIGERSDGGFDDGIRRRQDRHAAAGRIAECEYSDCDDGQEEKLDESLQATEAGLSGADKLRFLMR